MRLSFLVQKLREGADISSVRTLSVCMIVKNEADMLGACLESIRDVADEIIIVDTGSTDDTVKIAQSYGAKVLHEEWQDDYSKARNVSLRAATKDWILVLDADERIATKDHPRLRQLLDAPKAAYLFTQRHYGALPGDLTWNRCEGQYPELEAGYEGFGMGELTRLFPNKRQIKFTGVVYEFVEPSIRANTRYRILRSHVPIHHYGNTAARREERQKDSWYYKLFKKKVQVEPSPRTWFEFGTMAQRVGELEEAESALRTYKELKPRDTQGLTRLAEVLALRSNFADAIDHFSQALSIDNLDPLVHLRAGVLYFQLRRFIFAEAHLKRALDLAPGLVSAQQHLDALQASRQRFLVPATVVDGCESAR